MKSRGVILFLLALFLVQVASASTPDFRIQDNFDYDLRNEINDVGDFVFTASPYIPELQNFNNFSIHTAQQFDVMTWKGTSSIIMTNPLGEIEQVPIIPNQAYTLQFSGEYIYRSNVNSSLNGRIFVSAKDPNKINLRTVKAPRGMDITFGHNNFTLLQEEIVGVNIEVDDDIESGEYEIIIGANNKNITRDFEVLVIKEFDLEEKTVNDSITLNNGDDKDLGYFLFKNTGNADFEITSIAKGNNETYIFILPDSRTIYRKSYLRVDVVLQIPSTFKAGEYEYELEFKGGETEYNYSINVTILDGTEPTIESIDFSTDKADKLNMITVIAKDNNEVKNLTMEYNNKVVTFIKDGSKFTYETKFDKLSRYIFDFCAYDFDNNVYCEKINKTFTKTKLIVNTSKSLVLPSKKIGLYSKIKLFDLTENVPESVTLQLLDFVSTNTVVKNGSYSARIIDGDGTVKRFGTYENVVEVSNKGEIFLEVRAEEVANLRGIIRVLPPSYAEEVTDMQFSVSFKDYDIVEDFTKQWVDGRDMKCVVRDTGDLDSSGYICEMEYPINTRPEDISIPTTVKERESFEKEADEVREALDDSKKKSAIIISLLIAGLILIGLLFYFFMFQYPYIRFSTGHKMKENK